MPYRKGSSDHDGRSGSYYIFCAVFVFIILYNSIFCYKEDVSLACDSSIREASQRDSLHTYGMQAILFCGYKKTRPHELIMRAGYKNHYLL